MKKAIAILLVLLVAGTVFGAANVIDLTATVGAVAPTVKISKDAAFATIGAFNTATDTVAVDFNGEPGAINVELGEDLPSIENLFVNVRTNSPTSFNVKVTAQDMVHADVPEASIRYSVVFNNTTINSAAEHAGTPTTLLAVDGTEITGMSILSENFTIQFVDDGTNDDPLSVRNALAGSYSGNVIFSVEAQ